MNDYIAPPSLSTPFSESGKDAKKRFGNILNTKSKKKGVLALSLILLFVIFSGLIIGFSTNNILYTHNVFELSFETPKDWENKYEIKIKENIVYVYHKAIYEKYKEGAGLLFYIEMLKGDYLTHEDIQDPGNRSIVLKDKGFTYVFGMPTDVQYPIWEGGDKELAEDYLKMTTDFEKIKKSIKPVK